MVKSTQNINGFTNVSTIGIISSLNNIEDMKKISKLISNLLTKVNLSNMTDQIEKFSIVTSKNMKNTIKMENSFSGLALDREEDSEFLYEGLK